MPAKGFANDRLRPQQPRMPSLQPIRIVKKKKGPKQKSPFDPALWYFDSYSCPTIIFEESI